MRIPFLAFPATLQAILLSAACGNRAYAGQIEDKRLPAAYEHRETRRVCGKVLDAFPDDIDTDFFYLVIDRDGELLYAPVKVAKSRRDEFERLIGAEVSFIAHVNVALPHRANASGRLFTGPIYLVDRLRDIVVTRPSSATPFDVPELGDLNLMNPAQIGRLGRRRIKGHVTAAWNGHSILVETERNRAVRVELATPDLPGLGSPIEVAGFVGTDVFRLNLNRAVWRPADGSPVPLDEPIDLDLAQLCRNEHGERQFQFKYHGKPVRLKGHVRSMPAPDDLNSPFIIESGGLPLPVNISMCPAVRDRLEIGTLVEATGVCVMDVEGWRPNDLFPPIRGPFLVIRQASDIRIVAHPPWLTPFRASVLVLSLVAILIGILAWNRTLKIVADRRGRALLRQKLKNVRSQMSVLERTRLAVELHDSIAQTLTGVALELEAASLSAKASPGDLEQHLDIATRALDSCRDSLRNCLWDLRSDALDRPSFDDAIRRTLLPHCKGVEPTIRFGIPRSCFSDNTTHAILCIIRELVLNAIRHGKATNIKIVGAHDGDNLSFSVQDNGSGFDPKTAPGVDNGHFGLQGVRERIHKLGGSLSIASVIGQGTQAIVSLKIPQPKRKELP